MFGTKKIYCKIINGKLVVRVGGGYMGIEEFIMQYGLQETEKASLMQASEDATKTNAGYNTVTTKSNIKKAVKK